MYPEHLPMPRACCWRTSTGQPGQFIRYSGLYAAFYSQADNYTASPDAGRRRPSFIMEITDAIR